MKRTIEGVCHQRFPAELLAREQAISASAGGMLPWYTLAMSSVPATSHTKLCTLSVDLPESVAKLLGSTTEEATRHLAELAYIELFRQGQVSSGWAAERLGISKDDFRELLHVHDVPYIDMSEEELRRDVEVAMSLRRARSTS